MTEIKGKKVRCDVCQKTIQTKKFNVVLVYSVDYEERYVMKGYDDQKVDLDVCNDCVENLNFREIDTTEGKKK